MLYSVALCAQISSYCCVVDVEDYMCKVGKVLVGQSHCGSKSFVQGGFKSRFCTGDVGSEASVREQKVCVVMLQRQREREREAGDVETLIDDLKLKSPSERATWMSVLEADLPVILCG